MKPCSCIVCAQFAAEDLTCNCEICHQYDVQALIHSNNRYREALEQIVNGECYTLDAAVAIARAALDGEG